MLYYCCGITEKGVMPHNEDALLIGKYVMTAGMIEHRLEPPFVMAVSDGVSNENAGELASVMCLEKVREIEDLSRSGLQRELMKIHKELADFSKANKESCNMQTTLCGIAVDNDENFRFFNVGDSRLYLFREGKLRQLSRDQSLVQLLYEGGAITNEERKTHKHRNIIFPALGNIKDMPKIDITEIENGMDHGDVLLLCSDGLSDVLSNYEIEEIMELPKGMNKRLELLVKAALEHGCRDNISVGAVIRLK